MDDLFPKKKLLHSSVATCASAGVDEECVDLGDDEQ